LVCFDWQVRSGLSYFAVNQARRAAPRRPFLCWLACAVDLALKQVKPSALSRDIVQKHQALSFAFIPAVEAGETE
jgi:hypothetical protein